MACRVVCPVHVLALLTPRVVENRKSEPEAFRLYLGLLGRYAFSSPVVDGGDCKDKLAKLIDDALQLSHTYEVNKMNFGYAIVLFFLTVVSSLIDSTMEDWGLPLASFVAHANSYDDIVSNMNADVRGSPARHQHRENLRRTNRSMAIEVLAKMTSNKKAKVFLRLIHLNMPGKFNCLLQRLQIIEAHISASQSLTSIRSFLDSCL